MTAAPRARPDDLRELGGKYAELVRLREHRDVPHGSEPRGSVASELASLARRCPGALREIDELPMSELRARVAACHAAADDPARAAPWMHAVHLFHFYARGALAVKRHLRGGSVTDAARAELLAAAGPETLAWAGELERVASPPGGRLMPLVYARVAADLGVPEDAVRALVFPFAHRQR